MVSNLRENRTRIRFLQLILKTLILFSLFNLIYALCNPPIGKISGYNRLYPGLERFPYGNIPGLGERYLISDLDSLFASHEISKGPKATDEFRVIVLGDSSAWGVRLTPKETLSAAINQLQLTTCTGLKVRAYNLAYPRPSVAKDVFILAYAREYEPDLVLWPITLLAVYSEGQYNHPIIEDNSSKVIKKIHDLELPESFVSSIPGPTSLWKRSVIGKNGEINNIVRLQLFGMVWAATGTDQIFPSTYPPIKNDFKKDELFSNIQPHSMQANEISFDVLRAGIQLSNGVPVIIINEPTYISTGTNSNIRYNLYYPRWAYDQYLQIMANQSKAYGWDYHDFWNLLPPEEFTTNELHRSPRGEIIFAQQLAPLILSHACP